MFRFAEPDFRGTHCDKLKAMSDRGCSHLDAIAAIKQPERRECEECIKIASYWVHLRTCQTCGVTLCCDSSPNHHATAHYHQSNHPLLRSLEPGEDWSWCYIDEVGLVVREVTGATSIPPSPLGG